MTDEQLERRIEAHNFRIAALMALCESQPERRGEYRARARGLARQVAVLQLIRAREQARALAQEVGELLARSAADGGQS